MSHDDSSASAPPEVHSPEEREGAKAATVETENLPALSPEALAAFENLVPLLVEPETLIQGLRYLQQRIPGFVQLSISEERSMARAAYLSPEILDVGIHSAGAWTEAKEIIGWSGEELRRTQDTIRRWEGVERELDVLTRGVHGANLRLKHSLGLAILDLYALMRRKVSGNRTDHSHLRPYVEEMRRAFLRMRGKKKRGK
jgi:hypothetical protein